MICFRYPKVPCLMQRRSVKGERGDGGLGPPPEKVSIVEVEVTAQIEPPILPQRAVKLEMEPGHMEEG
jgi:hypothetical protein